MTSLDSILDGDHQLDVLMARQPIYSKNQDVVAFELLFRGDDPHAMSPQKDEVATFDVVMNTYASVVGDGGEQRLPFYLKVTDKVLLSGTLPALPPALFALELLGRSNVTPELAAALQEKAKEGYKIVLADYDPNDVRLQPLLNIAHVVKLDIQALGMARLPEVIQKLRPHNLDLLADKVETKEEFRQCLEMGFSLYQGFFLSRPEPIKGKRIAGNKVLLLQLLTELDRETATGASLEQIAMNDPALTYKILKVVNSAAFKVPREVESLSHAITLLGLDQIRRWILLFLTTGVNGSPTELTRNMLIRGRMCELIAELSGYQGAMNYFMVGLLSQLDALFDIEMAELLEQVPLNSGVKNALLHYTGSLGDTLRDVENYERGQFDLLMARIPRSYYEVAYRHSLNWSDTVIKALRG